MTDTNATTLRNALASAIKSHVADSGLTAKDAAAKSSVQLSRLYQVLRGDVDKISSDALVNILGGFGYRLTGINGSGNGTEIVLSLDKADDQVLPEIEAPAEYSTEQPVINPTASIGEDGNISISHVPEDPYLRGISEKTAARINEEADTDAGRVVADDE